MSYKKKWDQTIVGKRKCAYYKCRLTFSVRNTHRKQRYCCTKCARLAQTGKRYQQSYLKAKKKQEILQRKQFYCIQADIQCVRYCSHDIMDVQKDELNCMGTRFYNGKCYEPERKGLNL